MTRHRSVRRRWRLLAAALCAGLFASLFAASASASGDFPDDVLGKNQRLAAPVDTVWSGHPVGFALVTTQTFQLAAYYNGVDRHITLAARDLDSDTWFRTTLSDTRAVGWDSHNYLAVKIDSAGYVHLSGNMHYSDTMIYYRSAQPMTAAAQIGAGFMQRVASVLNPAQETRLTYPTFLTGPNGEFLFSYRNHSDVGLKAGSLYLARYDAATRTFSSATGGPALFSWSGAYSAYPECVAHGGYLHCFFMWRGLTDNGDIGLAEDNYRLSYMRTADLANWTDAFGRSVALPVTPATTLTTVDDIPRKGGLANGQPALSFDRNGVPMLAYHKYDAGGKSQIHVARPVAATGAWRSVQLTRSVSRWQFSGGGTISSEANKADNSFATDDPLDGVSTVDVQIETSNGKDPSSGPYIIDDTTLTPLFSPPGSTLIYTAANTPLCVSGPATGDSNDSASTYQTPEPTPAKMLVRRSPIVYPPPVEVHNYPVLSRLHYYLRWETLPSNGDRTRKTQDGVEILPPASDLLLYRTACEFPRPTASGRVAPTVNAGNEVLGFMFKPSAATLSGSMARRTDAGAFGDHLVSTAGYAPANVASWTFDIASGQKGDYALGGAAFAQSANDDSFYVQIDGGPLLDWHLTGRNVWNYEPVSAGPTHAATAFALSGDATHTLRVYAREPGAKLEYLWLSKVGRNKLPPSYGASEIADGFVETPDIRAVSGHAVGLPQGSAANTGVASYRLPVPVRGCYALLGRTQAPNPSADSFYLSYQRPQDSAYAPAQTWNLPNGAEWTWRTAQGGDNLLLEPGALALKLAGRESGARLDAFMLMFKRPVGAGGACD